MLCTTQEAIIYLSKAAPILWWDSIQWLHLALLYPLQWKQVFPLTLNLNSKQTGVQRSPTWELVWVVVWWVKPQPQLEVWTLWSATMFRWVAKLESQNSRLYQLIATLYSKPGADLDTFSRVALKSDGVDFMYCIAYTMKIPSQPPKKPQLKLQLSWICWIILVVLWSLSFFRKKEGGRHVLMKYISRRDNMEKKSATFQKNQSLQHFDAAKHHLWNRRDQHGSWNDLQT